MSVSSCMKFVCTCLVPDTSGSMFMSQSMPVWIWKGGAVLMKERTWREISWETVEKRAWVSMRENLLLSLSFKFWALHVSVDKMKWIRSRQRRPQPRWGPIFLFRSLQPSLSKYMHEHPSCRSPRHWSQVPGFAVPWHLKHPDTEQQP